MTHGNNMAHVKVVLPGDVIGLQQVNSSKKTLVGPGLRMVNENITVTKSGILKFKEPNMYWVETQQKRYVPVRGEQVLGVVTMKAGDVYRVDVGGSDQATLSFLSFENATKRNRPDVKVGDIVYGRLLVANKDMEPELVCIDGKGKSSGMGVIRDGGYMMQCSLNLVRKCRSPQCDLLKCLGQHVSFESVIGDNGRVWIKGRSEQETIAIANAISSAEYMDKVQIERMCNEIFDAISRIGS